MSLVLLIDDEKNPMKYYLLALRKGGFRVIQKKDPVSALNYVNLRKPDIIILDIMMPPGKKYKDNPDCDHGLRTGFLLYPELKEICPDIPYIVLTNITNPTTIGDFLRQAPDIPIYQKIDTPPFDLVQKVKEALK